MKISERNFPILNQLKKYRIRHFSKEFNSAALEFGVRYIKGRNDEFLKEMELIKAEIFTQKQCYIFGDVCVFFAKEEGSPYVFCLSQKGTKSVYAFGIIDDNGDLTQPTHEDVPGFLSIVYVTEIFLKYAEIETKILKPGQKEGKLVCKYKNDSKVPIEFVTSNYFTNLIKGDAFKVSGHFRLQPYNLPDGTPHKKLIWINEFQKSGYTRKADKLKED